MRAGAFAWLTDEMLHLWVFTGDSPQRALLKMMSTQVRFHAPTLPKPLAGWDMDMVLIKLESWAENLAFPRQYRQRSLWDLIAAVLLLSIVVFWFVLLIPTTLFFPITL